MDVRKNVLGNAFNGMQMLHNNFVEKHGVPIWEYQPKTNFGRHLMSTWGGLLDNYWARKGLPQGGLLAMPEEQRRAYLAEYLKK